MDDFRVSKTLSLVLRHDPGRIGITLDSAGWVVVHELLEAMANRGWSVSAEQLRRVVATNDKQRFAFDDDGLRIRANQGHSVQVDLGLTPARPPDLLFHGTPTRNLDSILKDGLRPGDRHDVHLSADVVTAHRVGARRGAHIVLVVDSAAMHADGHVFTVSANGSGSWQPYLRPIWASSMAIESSRPPQFLSSVARRIAAVQAASLRFSKLIAFGIGVMKRDLQGCSSFD